MNERREQAHAMHRFGMLIGIITLLPQAVIAGPKQDKIGLMVIAHGSQRLSWNETLRLLEPQVREVIECDPGASAYHLWDVNVCFLEGTTPTIETVLSRLERDGCTRVVAVPLFVAPGGHVSVDIPKALGLIPGQGRATDIPVVLTGPLSTGKVLERWAVSQVRALSTTPEQEAVVLLAHGGHDPLVWEQLMRRMASHVCGATGATYADWAIVQVGQSYRRHGVEVIQRALQHRPRVIVLGAYAALSAARIHEKWAGDIRFGGRVAFSRQGVLPNPDVPRWIVTTALAALPSRTVEE